MDWSNSTLSEGVGAGVGPEYRMNRFKYVVLHASFLKSFLFFLHSAMTSTLLKSHSSLSGPHLWTLAHFSFYIIICV